MSEGQLQASDGISVTGEARDSGPVIVVTAVHLSAEARAALAEKLGPGYVVRDIREAGNRADIVLVPTMSGHGVGELRSMFPGAKILAGEFVSTASTSRDPCAEHWKLGSTATSWPQTWLAWHR